MKLREQTELLEKATDNAIKQVTKERQGKRSCLLYTSPSPRDGLLSRMPSSA